MRLFFSTILVLALSNTLYATGAWYKTPKQILDSKKQGYTPAFVLLKAAVFSKDGAIRKTLTQKERKDHCLTNVRTTAWVTHRLSKGETLSKNAGQRLGRELSAYLVNSCFSKVELNIEPIEKVEPWLLEFLFGVKSELKALQLHLAVPALSPQKLLGPSWDIGDVKLALAQTDGLDFMLYDTGITSDKDYISLVTNAVRESLALLLAHRDKTLILGLPTYHDKTKFHQKSETLANAFSALKNFSPLELEPICAGRLQIAYYAGWTMQATERAVSNQIRGWKQAICETVRGDA